VDDANRAEDAVGIVHWLGMFDVCVAQSGQDFEDVTNSGVSWVVVVLVVVVDAEDRRCRCRLRGGYLFLL